MKVRAKFKVQKLSIVAQNVPAGKDEKGVRQYVDGRLYTIHASPVYGNGDPNHENTKFWEATPNGNLELGMINEETAKLFEIGKEYYVDLSDAP